MNEKSMSLWTKGNKTKYNASFPSLARSLFDLERMRVSYEVNLLIKLND